MPLILKETSIEKALFIWEISEKLEEFQRLMPSAIFNKIMENTKLEKRKIEKLSQVVLLQKAKIPYDQVNYLENGKPYITSNKHLSFSHSGIISSLLISNTKCGLDVEFPSDKIKRIQRKFIDQKEEELITKDDNLFWIWSIKEAIFKYFGEGVIFKDDIQVLSIHEEKRNAQVRYQGRHGTAYFDMKLLRIKNYYLAYTKSCTPE
jgi:phosphopantetheinyl transferase